MIGKVVEVFELGLGVWSKNCISLKLEVFFILKMNFDKGLREAKVSCFWS